MKKMVAIFLILSFCICLCACKEAKMRESVDDFNFTLVWGCYGISSYDSKTGKLVKTTDATRPKDYVTTLALSEEQMKQIGDILFSLALESYPDEYDPHLTENGQTTTSRPSMDLILTVEWNGKKKTIACRETSLQYTSRVEKGNNFLQACKTIIDILTSSEEWKALPAYEFLYD